MYWKVHGDGFTVGDKRCKYMSTKESIIDLYESDRQEINFYQIERSRVLYVERIETAK